MFLTDSPRPIRRTDVHKETLKNESVLFDPRTSTIYALNTTAALIWDHCDGKHEVEDIAEKIVARYNVNRVQVEKDVRKTLDSFIGLNLVMLGNHDGERENKNKAGKL